MHRIAQGNAVAEVPAQRGDHRARSCRLAVKLGLLREEVANLVELNGCDVDGVVAEEGGAP